MTPEESAELGHSAAKHIRVVILETMALPNISQVHWWGAFLATLAGFCHNDIGPEAHSILQGVNAAALKSLTTKGKRH